jgi:hypothetical protein
VFSTCLFIADVAIAWYTNLLLNVVPRYRQFTGMTVFTNGRQPGHRQMFLHLQNMYNFPAMSASQKALAYDIHGSHSSKFRLLATCGHSTRRLIVTLDFSEKT